MVRLWSMRGDERFQDEMFSCVTLEQRVPQDHPLREIRSKRLLFPSGACSDAGLTMS